MTAHTAKGLEFRHVFVIRAGSNSFPAQYKETLVEFRKNCVIPNRSPPAIAKNSTRKKNAASSTSR